MQVRQTVEAARPPAEVYARLAQPEQRGADAGWSGVSRSGDECQGVLHAAAGPIAIDFDCRFQLVEIEPDKAVRLRGIGTSPRLGFTFDVRLGVEATDAGSRVAVDGDVAVSGPLAGLGQRRLTEQARRVLTAYINA
jgi:carbon monoxide dehydrogenase subunit G